MFNVTRARKCGLREHVQWRRSLTKCERARLLGVQTSYHLLMWAGVYYHGTIRDSGARVWVITKDQGRYWRDLF